MSPYILWSVASYLSGNPLLAAVMVFGGMWALNRYTVRFFPSPFRFWTKWKRLRQVKRNLVLNPHDRRARQEYAEHLIEKGNFDEAATLLKQNLQLGDEDEQTLFLLGQAYLGKGDLKQGEYLMRLVKEQSPRFRLGESDLLLARAYLSKKKWSDAHACLQQVLKQRQGAVEVRVLLAQACEALGDSAQAEKLRSEAWREYAAAPLFSRRKERFWAYRAQPWRAALLGLVVLITLCLAITALNAWAQSADSTSPDAMAEPYR